MHDECWGPRSYCCKFNHRSEKCFYKDAQKKEPSKKAKKAQNNKQKKKKKAKKATEHTERRQTEAEKSDSDISEEESPKKGALSS